MNILLKVLPLFYCQTIVLFPFVPEIKSPSKNIVFVTKPITKQGSIARRTTKREHPFVLVTLKPGLSLVTCAVDTREWIIL